MQSVRLAPATREGSGSNDSSPTAATTSLPLSAPLRLPPELTNNSKFGFAFPDTDPGTTSIPIIPSHDDLPGEPEPGRAESPGENGGGEGGPGSPGADMPGATPLPRLARAFSMPVASQLGHLRHPRRPPGFRSPNPSSYSESQPYTPGLSTIYSAPQSAVLQDYVAPREAGPRFSGLSLELADTAQLVIQTLLQLSPPHLLDPAKEQFSGCTLQLPTTSVGAMLTAMKGLNWMSVRLAGFVEDETAGLESIVEEEGKEEVFDVGEMLQNVGDVLGGIAAQAGIDVVIYHADVGMKHVSVKGDEGGASYVLSHIVRQIIAIAEPGDTIELGLLIETTSPDRLVCSFDITHRLSSCSEIHQRLPPQFDTIILRRLLTHIRATLQPKPTQVPSSPSLTATTTTPSPSPATTTNTNTTSAPPPTQSYTLSIPLTASQPTPHPSLTPAEEAERQPFPTLKLAREPSLDELARFAEGQLRGKKATFYASARSSFAHHLTSYLTAWGMNVEHMGVDGCFGKEEGGEDGAGGGGGGDGVSVSGESVGSESGTGASATPTNAAAAASGAGVGGAAFIIIDDNIPILRKRLLQLRAESFPSTNLSSSATLSRKRPSLAANHRPRSSPQIRQLVGIPESPHHSPHPTSVVIHFTSLANFKAVRDVVQSVLFIPGYTYGSAGVWGGGIGGSAVPEVLVIPKPAGPRRFLTALHTATTKPMVDPVFSPIATSPMSPSSSSSSSSPAPGHAHSHGQGQGQGRHRPSPGRAGLQPSPLAIESREYFSETAELVLESATSPEAVSAAGGPSAVGVGVAGGVVLQDHEGRPAGILFQPRRGHTVADPGSGSGPGAGGGGSGGGVGGVRKSAPTSPSTPVSGGGASAGVSAGGVRRVSGDSEIGAGGGSRIVGTPARAATVGTVGVGVGTNGTTGPAQPVFVRTKSGGGRSNTSGRSRQNSANKLDTSTSALDDSARKESSSGKKAAGEGGRKDGMGRRRASGSEVKSPGVGGKPGAAKGKKAKDGGIVPPISVLIVEDNPINQTILSTFIKRKKIKCEVAQNGLQAVEKWKTGRFHLIFMDIQMPVMDGIEATREIRRLEKVQHLNSTPTPPIESPSILSDSKQLFTSSSTSDSKQLFMSGPSSPFRSSVVIVALTASSLQSDRVTALAAGCNDFLTKPVGLDWLDKKIIEWGSIKALQMWADPGMAMMFQRGQEAKAKAVATQLRIDRAPSRARLARASSLSKEEGTGAKDEKDGGKEKPGLEIHVQAPTPPVVEAPIAPSKPPIVRSTTKSPSPLSRSMMLPTEPPPPPLVLPESKGAKDPSPVAALTEQLQEVKAGQGVEASKGDELSVGHEREGSAQPSESADVPEMVLDAPLVAPRPVSALVNGTPPVLDPAPDPGPAPASDSTLPVSNPVPTPTASGSTPAVSVPAPAAQDSIPTVPNVAPTDAPARSPLPQIDPTSPAETINTETAYHSADSRPASPGDPSS